MKTKEIKFYKKVDLAAATRYIGITAKEPYKRMVKTTARVNVKNDAGKVVQFQDYDKVVFEGNEIVDGKVQPVEDMETLLGVAIEYFQEQVGKDGSGVLEMLKCATYAHDLNRRSSIRQALVAAAEGPDKAINKAVKDLMAAKAAQGKPISEEEARRRVMAD
jgi:hypothetical protein